MTWSGGRSRWILAVLLASACTGRQSALDPAGPNASAIAEHWWWMLALGTAVFIAVVGALSVGLVRSPSKDPVDADGRARLVAVAVGVSVLILMGVFLQSLHTSSVSRTIAGDDALRIDVTGHQWWWEVRYGEEDEPSLSAVTANELHLPVGVPVRVHVRSSDVIHSFWVPSLAGKIDLIPGRTNALWLRADRPGVFRGQCAEFCGLQHAKMGLIVVAHPPAQFAAWLDRQRSPAAPPADPAALEGQRVFMQSTCAVCHTIKGTPAFGQVAPDLTHLASRSFLAAATLPNNRGNLAAWIIDPQHVKPGSHMPPTQIDAESLHSLLAYLETLR